MCTSGNPSWFRLHSYFLDSWNCVDQLDCEDKREERLPPPENVSRSFIGKRDAPVGFSQVVPSTFSWAPIGWFTCASVLLCCAIISLCVCSVFYSKSPWETRAFAAWFVGTISWLVLMFFYVSWGWAGLIPPPPTLGFLSGLRYRPTTLPLYFAPERFFRSVAWSVANSNRDLPVCPLSAVTPAAVTGFFFTESHHTGS